MNPWILRFQKIIFLFLIGGFAFVFFYFSKIDSVELKIDSSFNRIKNNQKIQKEIKQYLDSYKGQLTWKISLKQIDNDLRKFYSLGHWHIMRRFPNHMVITLSQEEPISLLFKNQDEFYPVFFNGNLGASLDFKQNLNFPILRGASFANDISLRKEITSLLVQLPKKGLLTSKNVSEVKYQKNNKSFLLFLVSHNFVIEVGKAIKENQVQKVNFVLNYLITQKTFGRLIDSRFEKKIIVNTIK